MEHFEALYGMRCRTLVCWEEVDVKSFHRPFIVSNNNEKIKQIVENLKISRSRQKSYADNGCRPLEFEKGEKVL